MTAMLLADILYDAGLPPEMFSVITGWPQDIGLEMIQNPNIDLITFTGSVGVGKYIAEQAGYKRTVLELGGNDPLIVLNDLTDDDLKKAVELAVTGATKNSGQRCTAVKRILCQNKIADRFVEMALERAKKIKFGNPMDLSTDLGTVVNAEAAELFDKRVSMAEADGAKVLYHPGREGALLPPIVVDNVNYKSELVLEETFGPIIPIIRVPDEDEEVIKISNSTAFGLSSGVCTNNFMRAKNYIEMSPFGGIKDSGLGYKEGVIEAMKSFTNVKTFSLPW
jgi:acyl-CoA reductase-like NAD-dependent aldehyde dehydrogenase